MPISLRTTTDMSVEKGLEVFGASTFDWVYELAQESAELVRPMLLEDLQFYPPKPPQSKYVRTYRLKRGWIVSLERKGNSRVDFFISNDVSYAIWVVGSFAQNLAQARKYQRDFHAIHGWPLASETGNIWFVLYNEDFEKRFDSVLKKLVTTKSTTRAYTRIKR